MKADGPDQGWHVSRPVYRMYVDEVGSACMEYTDDPNSRYLSLTGVIMRLDHVRDILHPAFDALKVKYFLRDPDNRKRIIFHRKELMQRLYPFDCLKDPATCAAFDAEMLELLERLEFKVVTAVIDKAGHVQRYGIWAAHPYHYCLEVLLERYVLELRERRSRGDVMAEARGTKEDRALKGAYKALWTEGTDGNVKAHIVQQHITTRELKLEKKIDDIAGLQLADLLAHPSYRAMKLARDGQAPKDDFGNKIAKLLERSKYRRSGSGKIDGWGRKWLP